MARDVRLTALESANGYAIFGIDATAGAELMQKAELALHRAKASGRGRFSFYDGALGPGTGSFFVFILVGLLGYSFLVDTVWLRRHAATRTRARGPAFPSLS